MRNFHFWLVVALGSLSACTAKESPLATVNTLRVEAMMVSAAAHRHSSRHLAQVKAIAHAEIRPQVNGLIIERLFEEGLPIRKGQALYQIDDKEYRAQHAIAAAKLKEAQSTLDFAVLRLQRTEQLRISQALSQQELDERKLGLAQAQAHHAIALAEFEYTAIQLSYCTVRSPIDGVIGHSRISVGALVSANQAQPLAEVTQLSPLWVDIQRPLTHHLHFDAQGAEISMEFKEGDTLKERGKVMMVEHSVSQSSNSVLIRARFDNTERRLLPGMQIEALLSAATPSPLILIPQTSVTRLPNGKAQVMVINDKSLTEVRVIELADAIGNHWAVQSGLNEGEVIILSGQQKLKPDTKVQAQLQRPANFVAGS